MLPHTKNPNYIPYHHMKTKPFSFTFYNPYTNTIPNMKKINSHISRAGNTNLTKKLSTRRFSHCFCSCVPQYLEHKENKYNYSILNDISQDSAICMDDNLYDYSNLPDEFCNMSEFSIGRTDSGVDMSNVIETNDINALQQSNFPVTSTMLDMHSISSSSLLCSDKKDTSSISAFSNCNTDDENVYTHPGLYNFKSSTLCKKNITQHAYKQCSNRETHLLKFCKNTQCTRSSFLLNKRIITPKRYVRWRRAKSCVTIHKINSTDKYKFKKMHSYPNLLRQYDLELNNSFLYDSSTQMTRDRNCLSTCKLSSSILSKFSHLNFSSISKQYVLVNPCQQNPETHQKQKYTPLPSPLPIPAKVAKLSNSEYGSRSTFTSDESYLNISSRSSILKGDHKKLDKQKGKPLSLVLFLFLMGYIRLWN